MSEIIGNSSIGSYTVFRLDESGADSVEVSIPPNSIEKYHTNIGSYNDLRIRFIAYL